MLFKRRLRNERVHSFSPPYPEELHRDIQGNSYYEEIVSAAKEIIEKNYKFGRHHIGSALRASSGKIFAAVHLETAIGRIAVCAETIAIGMACSAGQDDIKVIAAFSGRMSQVVSPCGMCRELIYDYSPDCEVIIPYLFVPGVPSSMALYKVPISELLPARYIK